MTHEIGAIVQVAYPEGEPEKAVIADGRAVAWMSFLTVFAALLVGLGVWLIRFDRRMLREEGWLD